MPTPGRLYKFRDGLVYQVLFNAIDIESGEYKIVYRCNKNLDKIITCSINYWKENVIINKGGGKVPWLIDL